MVATPQHHATIGVMGAIFRSSHTTGFGVVSVGHTSTPAYETRIQARLSITHRSMRLKTSNKIGADFDVQIPVTDRAFVSRPRSNYACTWMTRRGNSPVEDGNQNLIKHKQRDVKAIGGAEVFERGIFWPKSRDLRKIHPRRADRCTVSVLTGYRPGDENPLIPVAAIECEGCFPGRGRHRE